MILELEAGHSSGRVVFLAACADVDEAMGTGDVRCCDEIVVGFRDDVDVVAVGGGTILQSVWTALDVRFKRGSEETFKGIGFDNCLDFWKAKSAATNGVVEYCGDTRWFGRLTDDPIAPAPYRKGARAEVVEAITTVDMVALSDYG